MLRLLRGAFQRSAKVMKANSRSKLLVYPGVIIGVSAAAAATWKGNDYFVKYQALKKEEEEERELIAFRKEELRKLWIAYFNPKFSDDDDDYPLVFPPMNGRTVYQMVCDFEDEENKDKYQKFSPSAQCDSTMKIFTSDCATTKVKKTAEEDENLSDIRLEIQAKLRGMNTTEFLEYARHEKKYCKEMCAKCKEVPLPPGCDQETVNKYCGR